MRSDDRQALASWLRLVMTPQVGGTTARRLLATFGLPDHVFNASAAALAQLASPAQVAALRSLPPGWEAMVDAACEWLQADAARRIAALGEPDYPNVLLQTDDPPLMLWLSGSVLADGGPIAWPTNAIAMVGSRNPTPQGVLNARQFARSFVQGGWCVVSGLALGIDGSAHEGAVDGALPGRWATIAVVGTGLDRVYPRKHRELAHRVHEHGLLVSEYPLGTPPLAENFPRRNRVISGLSRGTLVVEAAVQSGSLITARMAAEQGREVFAIPGSIHTTQSRGCHALIKQGAKLVETAQDVLDELAPGTATLQFDSEPSVPFRADPVLDAAGFDPVSFDAMQGRTGLPTPALQARLLELELEGRMARLPGGLFQRLGAA